MYGVRCRKIPRQLLNNEHIEFQFRNFFRQYSMKDKFDNSYMEDVKKERNNNHHMNGINADIENRSSNNKISNIMNSFLHSSMENLENYIISQTPVHNTNNNNNSNQASNSELLEFELENELSNEEVENEYMSYQPNYKDESYEVPGPITPRKVDQYNMLFSEYLDLSNERDIEYILKEDSLHQYKVYNEIHQNLEKRSNCDISLILNFYIRSIPQLQKQFGIPESKHSTLTAKQTYEILRILINFQWFQAASFIISRMNLPFNELLEFLNDVLENELVFEKSNLMKYMFLIHFHNEYKKINPLVIKNLDFLSQESKYIEFQMIALMYNKNYYTISALKNDFEKLMEMSRNHNENRRNDLKLVYLMKIIDIYKMDSPLDLDKQVERFKNFLKDNEVLFSSAKNEDFLLIFLKHTLQLNRFEKNYILKNGTLITKKQTGEFLNARKDYFLDTIFLEYKMPVSKLAAIYVLSLRPSINVSLTLWNFHLERRSASINSTIYYRILVEKFIRAFAKHRAMENVIGIEFSHLSPYRKINIISNKMARYFKYGDLISKNHVGGYIRLTNQPWEHSHVMKQTFINLFYKGHKSHNDQSSSQRKYTYLDLLQMLELVSVNSPTTNNKENLFHFANNIIEDSFNTGDTEFFLNENSQDIFHTLIEFIEGIKLIDHGSIKYAANILPSTTMLLNNYIHSEINLSLKEEHTEIENFNSILEKDRYFKSYCKLINLSFDFFCSNDEILSKLNPKNYKSQFYISHHGLLRMIAIQIMKLPKEIIVMIWKIRANWIYSNDEFWIEKFNKEISNFGIFLEVFLRRSIRKRLDFDKMNHELYQKYLREEVDELSSNDTVWELVESLSGFKWNKQRSDALLIEKSIDENLQIDDGTAFGSGILDVLNALKKNEKISYIDKYKFISGLKSDIESKSETEATIARSSQKIENFDEVTDKLLDSLDFEENEEKREEITRNISGSDMFNLDQDLVEFNELYENIKEFNEHPAKRDIKNNSVELMKGNEKPSHVNKQIKKKYSFKEKRRMFRLYAPLRVKSMLVRSLIERNPLAIDELMRFLYEDYGDCIPVILLHNIMIGILKSKSDKIDFISKINAVKIMDIIVTLVYTGGSQRSQSYHYMKFVNFKKFKILLVDTIIKESSKKNAGSLKTLNWAMNKITSSPNLNEYEYAFKRWNNTLNNMKDLKVGFWNPSNDNRWD